MKDILLPIGSVCTLKDADKKIMITAFLVAEDSNSKKMYDYCGCLYPEGMIDSSNHFLFDRDKIDKIHHIGYSNEEEKEFKEKLYDFLKEEKQELTEEKVLKDNENVNNIFNTLNLNQQDNSQQGSNQ